MGRICVVAAELFLGTGSIVGAQKTYAAPEGQFLACGSGQLCVFKRLIDQSNGFVENAPLHFAHGQQRADFIDVRRNVRVFAVVLDELVQQLFGLLKILCIKGNTALIDEARGGEVIRWSLRREGTWH